MCGDCIPSVCHECSMAGHNGGGFWACPICKPIHDRKMVEMQMSYEAEQRAEKERRENDFGYGILESISLK